MAAALTACSSGVKLNDVPVEDKTGAAVTPGTADGSGVSQRPVAAVDLDKACQSVHDRYQPHGVFRLRQLRHQAQNSGRSWRHAKFLSGDKTRKIAIEGHTDERVVVVSTTWHWASAVRKPSAVPWVCSAFRIARWKP